MEYNYPNKEILEKNSIEIQGIKELYNLSDITYKKYNNMKLSFPIGKDIKNEVYYIDLSNITSIFIAGETGSGKSNFIHSIIISLLMKNSYNDIKFVLIDPKTIELERYLELPQTYKLYGNNTLNSLKDLAYVITIIEERRKLFKENNVKDINEYNNINKLPHIIVIIDEIKDIMDFNYTDNILDNILSEGKIYGIHLIMSTNMSHEKYINKKILNKFDYIISFDLADEKQASYIKIDGANLLKINGEAIIKGNNELITIQTPYISDNDINNVINYIKSNN